MVQSQVSGDLSRFEPVVYCADPSFRKYVMVNAPRRLTSQGAPRQHASPGRRLHDFQIVSSLGDVFWIKSSVGACLYLPGL